MLEKILLEDNPHWVDQDTYDKLYKREALGDALKLMEIKEVLAIIGARRVGKSSLAKLLIRELVKSVNPKNIFFINLEKPFFIPHKHDAGYLETIYDEYIKFANPDQKERIYFFIDEVQIFENWEFFVKSKYENTNIKFIITGSNSSLLESDFATVLTGRVVKLRLFGFSFGEFLDYKNIEFRDKISFTKNRIEIKRTFDEYMQWGGYFSVISADDEYTKREILANIAEDIILKDIVPRYKIKNSQEIKDMFFYLVSNATGTVNYSSLARKLGLDSKSVKEYINYFEDNFLLTRVSNYHSKLSHQIKSVKKLYLNDNGFLNLGVNRSQNLGAYLENLVFIKLYMQDPNITYIKEKQEIDFFAGGNFYQVSYDIPNEKTLAREIKAFESFSEIKHNENYLIVYTAPDFDIDSVKVLEADAFVCIVGVRSPS